MVPVFPSCVGNNVAVVIIDTLSEFRVICLHSKIRKLNIELSCFVAEKVLR